MGLHTVNVDSAEEERMFPFTDLWGGSERTLHGSRTGAGKQNLSWSAKRPDRKRRQRSLLPEVRSQRPYCMERSWNHRMAVWGGINAHQPTTGGNTVAFSCKCCAMS